MGKTPLLQDWVADLINGVTWCGRNVRRRPVIHLDFESNPSTFSESIRRICTQRDILLPRAPSFRPFLYLSDPKLPDTKELFEAIEGPTEKRFQWLDKLLSSTPDAVVIVDPFDMLFCIDLSKAPHVVSLYRHFRTLLAKYPKAAFVLTYNLRKADRKAEPKDLYLQPRSWLDEVGGSVKIQARADVRMGFDLYSTTPEKIRVLNGIRRGEDFHPLMLSEVGEEPNLAGFTLATPQDMTVALSLTPGQKVHWKALPQDFKFEDVADCVVPRASLSRLLKRLGGLGAIEQAGDGVWHKRVPL
jgi:hypothetical protein